MLQAGVGDPLLSLHMQQAMGKSHAANRSPARGVGKQKEEQTQSTCLLSGPSPFALSQALMESSWSSSLTPSHLS